MDHDQIRRLDVSFVVIAYNEERNIERCLKAILSQNPVTDAGREITNEIIVVDDGSVDRTAELAQATSERVRVIRLGANQGRGKARAAGIDAANGDNIAFVDADITIPAHWLETLWPNLAEAAATSGVAVPDGDIAAIARITGLPCRKVKGTAGGAAGSNTLIRGDILKRHPFPGTRLGEDFRYSRQLREHGYQLKVDTSLIVEHHEHKAWRRHVRWLWESGEDATRLLAEHRTVRPPDVAAAVFAASVIAAAIGPGKLVKAAPAAVSVAFTAAHMAQKLEPNPRWRWVAGVALHTPAMTAYLLGRWKGAAKLAVGR